MLSKMTQFVIGTAQFGMNYGIANSTGQPSEKTIREIIDCATTNEILYYDTAISYGTVSYTHLTLPTTPYV